MHRRLLCIIFLRSHCQIFNYSLLLQPLQYIWVSMDSRTWDLKGIFRCEGNLSNTEIVRIKLFDGIHHFRPNVPRLPEGWLYLYCNNQYGEQSICACKSFEALRITAKHWNCCADDVIMITKASQFSSVLIVFSTVCSNTDQRKHHSSASLAFVWGVHRWPVNSPHEGPITWKFFSFNDVIMKKRP